jgi:hypothetical protein
MSGSNINPDDDEDMLPEYDLTGGVCGKYVERYRQGTNVVLLAPDVAKIFMLTRSSLALVVVLGVTGCGATTTYQPANSPRLSVVHGGIYKNGKKYDDLLVAVADNPRALEEARTAKSIAVTSNWLFLGGLGFGLAAGVPLAVVGDAEHDKALVVTGLGILIAGTIVSLVGSVVAGHVGPHVLDAINIYNDDVEAKMFIRRPAPAPTGAPATSTPTPAPR